MGRLAFRSGDNQRAVEWAERALALTEGLAERGPDTIVYSSCNPDTLARDLPNIKDFATLSPIPGLRHLEKYAVRQGGGTNHRMGLWDAAMIKDNHVAVAGDVGEAVRRAKAAGVARIICEVDRIDQIEPALAAGASHLLLDNMPVAVPNIRVLRTPVGSRPR